MWEPTFPEVVFGVLYAGAVVSLFWPIWLLRRTHAHQIYLIWLSFSFFFVLFLLVGDYPALKPVVHYLTDINAEFKLVTGAIALAVVPQALTYFLAGLSGSASPPRFVKQVTDFMIWSLIKSNSAYSGFILATGIRSTHHDEYTGLVPLFPLCAAFGLALMHEVAGRAVNFIYQKTAFSPFRHVHKFFTRFSTPEARSSAQPGFEDHRTNGHPTPGSDSAEPEMEPMLKEPPGRPPLGGM